MIAALYVQTGGSYYGVEGVDPWDEARDARLYSGPWPVVAHPPCQRWGKLWAGQPLWIKRTGQRKVKASVGIVLPALPRFFPQPRDNLPLTFVLLDYVGGCRG